MILQIDFWQIVLALGALLAFFAGVIGALVHFSFRQFERRLQTQIRAAEQQNLVTVMKTDDRLQAMEAQLREIERQQATLRVDTVSKFVRREDQIRDQTVTSAKLDALAAKIELVTQIVARFEGPMRTTS